MEYKRMSEERPLLTNCCFVFSLRTGCFILGYLSLVLNLFWTLITTGLMVYAGVKTHGFDHVDDALMITDEHIFLVTDNTNLTIIALVLGLVLFVNIFCLLLNIVCLVGLHKKRPGLIRIQVIFSAICLFLFISATIYSHISGSDNSPKTIAIESSVFGLSAYFIMVYYVYANQLEKELKPNTQDAFSIASLDTGHFYPVIIEKEVLVHV